MPNTPTGDPKQYDTSQFSEGLSGSCLCGSITVTLHDKELFTKPRGHLCHCANCRKVAGSYVSSNLLIEAEKVTIEDKNGTLKCFEDTATLSGNPVYRYFCSTDGKYVYLNTFKYSLTPWYHLYCISLAYKYCSQSRQVRDSILSRKDCCQNGDDAAYPPARSGRLWYTSPPLAGQARGHSHLQSEVGWAGQRIDVLERQNVRRSCLVSP